MGNTSNTSNTSYISYINAEIYIKEEDINKDIRIINSFENLKKENKWEDKKTDKKKETKKR
jgi:hypothetical protein